MLVSELKKILDCLDDDAPVSFEYIPRPHEYVVEPVLGVRAEASGAIIIGEKNFSWNSEIFFRKFSAKFYILAA